MKVRNGRCIRNLSLKQMKGTRARNLISIFAIALTTLLFTALFTVTLSIMASYEEYNFRQAGGYCHGTFKEVDEEQIRSLSSHKDVKEYGLRTACGLTVDPPFSKVHAEISWMDANTAAWSYAVPTTGRTPESGMEVAMDTAALEKLGIPAELGAQMELTYREGNGFYDDPVRTDAFTLVGFWEYDELMPIHFINVSLDYVEQVEADYLAAGGDPFRTDMNVMLPSSLNIRETMEKIDRELGYQWEDRSAENCVRIGTNWGYSASDLGSTMDPGTLVAIVVFLLLVIFTGYLIIYNIFQISVAGDIRYYGLLKTIGTTPRQLRRIVRMQALFLSVIGIPMGCLLGYGVGAALLPAVLSTSNLTLPAKMSVSPLIFIGSACFALLTVWISCTRPARNAGKITPVEALRYTDAGTLKKKKRSTRGAGVRQMAFANLGRNKAKTVLVVASLSLAVVLLNCVVMFVVGFSMEKYLNQFSAADFLVGTTDYFNYRGMYDAGICEDQLREMKENTAASSGGCIYALDGANPICWLSEDTYRDYNSLSGSILEQQMSNAAHRGDQIGGSLMVEGFDETLLEKLLVYDGDLSPLTDGSCHAIAMASNEEAETGEAYSPLKVGDVIVVTYVDEARYFDSRTGELAGDTTPNECLDYRIIASHDVEYTVCALVGIPYSMSFRVYLSDGVLSVLSSDALLRDSNGSAHPMLYAFDSPNDAAEASAEQFLSAYTADNELEYESKELLRNDFKGFKDMFSLVGFVMCFVVGLVGILNFFNTILTGILTRRREFAILQSIGMTGNQLKRMLMHEGMIYAVAACGLSGLLALVINPVAASLLDSLFWFFSYRFTIWPVLAICPVFVVLGVVLPWIVYHFAVQKSIVERLRETE